VPDAGKVQILTSAGAIPYRNWGMVFWYLSGQQGRGNRTNLSFPASYERVCDSKKNSCFFYKPNLSILSGPQSGLDPFYQVFHNGVHSLPCG
jgi:hypothetical protein